MGESRSRNRLAGARRRNTTHLFKETLQTMTRMLGRLHLRAGLSSQEIPSSYFPQKLPVFDDHFAAGDHRVRRALDDAALVRRVVDALVERLGAQRELAVRVEDDEVGVRAGGDRPLLREEPEDLRGRSGGQLEEAVHGDAIPDDPAVVQEGHARLDAGGAVRDLREVALAELLLLLHAERAVVGRHGLQVVHAEAAPQRFLVALCAERRRHDVLRALEPRLLVVVIREEEVLRTRFGVHGQAAVARLGDLLEGLGGREVDDVERYARHFREADREVRRLGFGARRPRGVCARAVGAVGAAARPPLTSTSMTSRFSACMQIVPPFSPVLRRARKMEPSSSIRTPRYAMKSLNDVTPSLTRTSISLSTASWRSVMIMWKP